MRILVGLLVLAACNGGSATGDAPRPTGFTASPDTLIAGTPTQITWTWDFAEDPGDVSCEIDGVGPIESGGSSMVTLAASLSYTLRCTNDGGTGTASVFLSVAQDPVAPVIATLAASPNQLLTGVATDVTFTWTYTGTPAPSPTCTLDRGIGAVTNGVAKSITLPSTTQLVLTCTNSEGSDTENITITTVAAPVAPVIATFAPTPSTVLQNTATNVTWNWTYTGTPTPLPTCSINNGVGTVTPGQATSVNIAANTTYTLSCANTAGTNTRNATITAAAPVAVDIATFTADPTTVTANTATDIDWTWTYNGTPNPAATCSIDNNVGAVVSGDTTSINIAATTTYTLTCTNGTTNDTATLMITVQ